MFVSIHNILWLQIIFFLNLEKVKIYHVKPSSGIVHDSMHLINETFEGFLSWNIETINSILQTKLNFCLISLIYFQHFRIGTDSDVINFYVNRQKVFMPLSPNIIQYKNIHWHFKFYFITLGI